MLSAGVVGARHRCWVAFRRSQPDRLRQVTDSFEGAVTLLGHEDRSVRIGAIYALERIARQNREEHWPIMETLTAYVRERAPRPLVQKAESQESNPRKPATDVQAALTVIGRRRREYDRAGQRLDLAHSYLRGANLSHARLERANLSWTDLAVAFLMDAHLEGAWLHSATLTASQWMGAHLEGADLRKAATKLARSPLSPGRSSLISRRA